MNPYRDSAHLRADVAVESGGSVILSFSRGKDSLATWLVLRKTFQEVIPFYLERIPGLVFVQESLDYFERFFGCKIPVLPHPATYRQLRAYVFQPPERWPVIEGAIKAGRLPAIDYAGQEAIVRGWAGRDLPVAWGTRATDSPIRMANVRKHGPRNHQRGAFWAIYDWRMADVLAEIKASGVRLPAELPDVRQVHGRDRLAVPRAAEAALSGGLPAGAGAVPARRAGTLPPAHVQAAHRCARRGVGGHLGGPMKAFKDMQIVRVKSAELHGERVGLPAPRTGRVVRRRMKDDGAWVALAARLDGPDEALHPFPASDRTRSTHVLTFPEWCDLVEDA